MCTLSCVHWQLSLSFVLCPWEKPMSFYNANGLFKYKGVQIYDLKGGLTMVLMPRDRLTRSSPSLEMDL